MKSILRTCLLLLFISSGMTPDLFGQISQVVRGKVFDRDSRIPLIGATVQLRGPDTLGITTDLDGNFEFPAVKVGRYLLEADYVGYAPYLTNEVIVTSAKEVFVLVPLIESGENLETVVVSAKKFGNDPLNELSMVSTRSFSVEETQRYAASANDPSRMVMGFPGVQPSRDSRSDIVVRGNSAIGLLWRLEGIDIPNPNHFARKGSSGGGITIFSVSMLNNSDFSSGAFPAEYGNAFSGVFDMKFRNGNKQSRESTFRVGLLGTEFSTEGPIKEGLSSYLVNYRYSTLGILNSMGLRLVGERISNTFQDLSFKLNFSSPDFQHSVSVWGIGGLSDEKMDPVEGVENWRSYTDYLTRDFTTNMGALGINHTWQLTDRAYLRNSFGVMGQLINFRNDTLTLESVPTTINDEQYINNRFSFSSIYHNKISAKLALKTGAYVSSLDYDLFRRYLVDAQYQTFIDEEGGTELIQPFFSLRWQPTTKFTVVLGGHGLFFNLNQTSSIEPRLSLRYRLNENQDFTAAYGLHSRIAPIGMYFFRDSLGQLPNFDLDLIKSHHFVLGYTNILSEGLKFSIEAYYQSLFDVPVSADPNSTFSILNQIDGFARRPLVSEGTGTNVGVDITLEKAFRDGLFFLLAASVYDSQYEPLDGKSYNTLFNGGFNTSFMGGKEWNFSGNAILQTSLRILYNGGQRLTPVLSIENDPFEPLNPLLDESQPFTEQVSAYFRPDIRIAYRKNNPKTSWILSLDVQNVIGRRNIDAINRDFDPDLGEWVFREQSAAVPVLTYQIDF